MAFTEQEKQLIIYGKANGKSLAEVEDALIRLRAGVEAPKTVEKPEEGNSMVKDLAIGAAKGLGDTVRLGADMMTEVAPDIIAGPIVSNIPGFDEKVKAPIKAVKDQALEKVGLTEENLKSDNTTQKVGKAVEFVAEFATPLVATRLASIVGRIPTVAAKVGPKATGLFGRGTEMLSGLKTTIQRALAKETVDPQLEASTQRLIAAGERASAEAERLTAAGQKISKDTERIIAAGEKAKEEAATVINDMRYVEGTKRLEDPVAVYDKYVTQSKKALTDIKEDPAISLVGEEIGNAFGKVVQKRRAVGKVMGEELKKVGGIKTNVADDLVSFDNNIAESGLSYSDEAKALIRSNTSKMTDEDLSMVNDYYALLQKLGKEPTIAEIDAFISRTEGMVSNFKSAKNIVNTTNGERLIKISQSALRDQFDPTKTGNAALQKYAEARKGYSELSNFMKDGGRYLGNITQSGDFEKDASIAKSAVQSILNNGKKDWLIKLEELTGYPAMDDSVLALQAMKDAGDYRGVSLLQTLSEGSTPTNARGITQKAIDYALEKVARVAAGTPEQQTRAFLEALKEAAEKGIK